MGSLKTISVDTTVIPSTYTSIWAGDQILVYALFKFSSDDFVVGIFNNDQEIMTFDLPDLKTVYKVDATALQDPIFSTYSAGRWCLDLRKFDGLYPEGVTGIEIKLKTKSGSKTLEKALIVGRMR
jgi:hypothetical protein